jgi:hypothetical protein
LKSQNSYDVLQITPDITPDIWSIPLFLALGKFAPRGTLTISGDKGKQNLKTQCMIRINPCAVAAEITT